MLNHPAEPPFSHEASDKILKCEHLGTPMDIDSGAGTFSCEICDNKFNTSAELKTHMGSHTIIFTKRVI